MSNHRKALIANGLLVLAASLTAMLDPSGAILEKQGTLSDWGRWITYGMGASLIYSGATDFCGFALIFEHLQKLTNPQPDRS